MIATVEFHEAVMEVYLAWCLRGKRAMRCRLPISNGRWKAPNAILDPPIGNRQSSFVHSILRFIRLATNPAPNPLSMLTTVTLEAQIEHAQQRRDAAKRRSVADACRNGDHRNAHQPAHD